MAISASPPILQSLPPEIVEKIFVQSENFSLSIVSRRLYSILSKPVVRLHFCTHIFYWGNPKRLTQTNFSRMKNLQTEILAQTWFTNEFSSKVEKAVLALQESAYQKSVAEANMYNETHSDSWHSPGKNKVTCDFVRLPRHALSGPWTNDNINFLHRLMRWNARRGTADGDMAEKGMRAAILEGKPEPVKLLSEPQIGVELDQELLQLAVIAGGCNRAIVKIFVYAALEDESLIYWQDKKLLKWARQKTKEGDEKGQWLSQLLDTEGEEVSEDEFEFYF